MPFTILVSDLDVGGSVPVLFGNDMGPSVSGSRYPPDGSVRGDAVVRVIRYGSDVLRDRSLFRQSKVFIVVVESARSTTIRTYRRVIPSR